MVMRGCDSATKLSNISCFDRITHQFGKKRGDYEKGMSYDTFDVAIVCSGRTAQC